MKKNILIPILLFSFIAANSQEHRHNSNHSNMLRKQIDNEKNIFFTQKMELSQSQAPLFWSIYNQYKKEDKVLHQKEDELLKRVEAENITEAQYEDIFTNLLQVDNNKRKLKEKLYKDLNKVLTPKQKLLFYVATKQYRCVLLNKLKLQKKHVMSN